MRSCVSSVFDLRRREQPSNARHDTALCQRVPDFPAPGEDLIKKKSNRTRKAFAPTHGACGSLSALRVARSRLGKRPLQDVVGTSSA